MRNYGYDEGGKTVSISDLGLWRRIARYSYDRLGSFSVAVFLSLALTGATLAQPWLMQRGIDSFITSDILAIHERFAGLADTAFWYLLMVLAVFLLSFLQVLLLEYIGQSIMHSIRQDLFRHMLRLDLPFFNTNPLGKLVTRLTNDIQNMHEMFTSVMVTMFNDLLRIAGILFALFLMNPRLALIMSFFVPISLTLTFVFARLAREKFRAIRTQLARINSFLSESLSGMSILQLFGRHTRTRDDFEEMSLEYQDRALSQIKLFGMFMPITEFMGSAAMALILWYGGGEILQQRLTIGELVAFISYMRLFFQPLRELSQKYSIVQSAMASAERIFQLLDTKNTIEDPTRQAVVPSIQGDLQFTDVTFGYSPGTPVIRNINLCIKHGQTVALVGTTGSGKTTLVNLLLRFYEPQHGTITIDDTSIGDFSLHQLRNIVGVVLQDVLILQDTLLTNIVMDTGKSRESVEEILQKTGMQRFVALLPQGLDTRIGEGGQELSTGEKQLLSFARVLCRDPKILVLDEATAAIDTESENILEAAIEDIFSNRTSLIIAHRLSTIRRADHIIVMDSGSIVEQGSHDELMALAGHYSSLVAMDLQNGRLQ
ncbi:ABC transporter ATP-binding protein [Desulfosediminicola flagellatus]|uniref:ABC transporter ATP-binding protein n=1 Tax=Desulfosediminicola flagellatus TaxID=2569541 RepID=UPI0010AD11CB|nr:ABC transporter ATP-binding protein [Desulfosediminicola flagellatus]